MDTSKLNNWLSQITNNNSQKEYYLTDIVALAKKDNIKVVTHEAKNETTISGINSKAELVSMEKFMNQKKNIELIEQGVKIMDPSRTEIRGSLDCGSDVEIDVGCIFEGNVKLGNNVKVGAYTHIKDSTILNDTNIKSYSHIEASEVGENNNIGPYARLRPGVKTKKNVHIGNFVEIKNSEIGIGTKINHLSYVGDSEVGENVNIGAGCITCNYDGVNKHKTIIEDDVFVGSNSQLVAPLTIGTGSTIGAGSTITKDTPVNQLSLSRSKQTSIPSWERPKKK
jgi:bifunctional UDP-N-acetylglucosamine pyrophosphorylase/glucosamine-1-phosphate N-acetyltransferase